jgi:hypothetical protein
VRRRRAESGVEIARRVVVDLAAQLLGEARRLGVHARLQPDEAAALAGSPHLERRPDVARHHFAQLGRPALGAQHL